MLTTKAFAIACKTSKRTIRYYDQLGLLTPAKRQDANRLYVSGQVLKFEKIRLLRSLGFNLSEIQQSFIAHETLEDIFRKNHPKAVERYREISEQLNKMNELLGNLQTNKSVIAPIVRQISGYQFCGLERRGKYAEIPAFCQELAQKIDDAEYKHTYLAVLTDAEYLPMGSRMIIGAKYDSASRVALQDVSLLQVPNHMALTYVHTGSHAYLGYMWELLIKHARINRLQIDHAIDPREVYLKGPFHVEHDEDCVTELQLPIIERA